MAYPLDTVIKANSIQEMTKIPDEFAHLILSDIPYGIGADDWDVLHSNTNKAYLGTSPGQIKAGAVFKKRGKPINGWSEADKKIPREYQEWCAQWASEWLRVLKPGGSAIIFAGRRLSHRCISALEDEGFVFKDMFAWLRHRAPHRAQRVSLVYERRQDWENAEKWIGWRLGNLRPTFEPILWLMKPYKVGSTLTDNLLSNQLGAYNEEAFLKYTNSPDNILKCGFRRGEGGLHPTQKPVDLMKALIELTTLEGHVVIDPFCGSGSTLLAAKELKRRFIGFDINDEYVEIAKGRLSKEKTQQFSMDFLLDSSNNL